MIRHEAAVYFACQAKYRSRIPRYTFVSVSMSFTEARSFLHSQVRSMVGSLVWVGEGRWSADDLAAALAARNRAACGVVAPPEGLYLVKVDY